MARVTAALQVRSLPSVISADPHPSSGKAALVSMALQNEGSGTRSRTN